MFKLLIEQFTASDNTLVKIRITTFISVETQMHTHNLINHQTKESRLGSVILFNVLAITTMRQDIANDNLLDELHLEFAAFEIL